MQETSTIQWLYQLSTEEQNKRKIKKNLWIILISMLLVISVFFGTGERYDEGLFDIYEGSYGSMYFIFILLIIFFFIVLEILILHYCLKYRKKRFIITNDFLEITEIKKNKIKRYRWNEFSAFSSNLVAFTKDTNSIALEIKDVYTPYYLKLKKGSHLGLVRYVKIMIDESNKQKVYQALKGKIKESVYNKDEIIEREKKKSKILEVGIVFAVVFFIIVTYKELIQIIKSLFIILFR